MMLIEWHTDGLRRGQSHGFRYCTVHSGVKTDTYMQILSIHVKLSSSSTP